MDRETSTDDMAPIDILEGIANDCAWLHTRPDEYSLVIERTLKHGTYGMSVEDEEDDVRFSAIKPFVCPGFAELELLRLLNLFNGIVRPGHFIYHKKANQIIYQTSLDFCDERPLTAEGIEHRTNAMLHILDAAHYCLESVAGRAYVRTNETEEANGVVCLNPGMTAEEALDLFNGEWIGHA